MSTNEESIFAAAIKLETERARSAFLDEACASDAAMRDRIAALVRSHQEASGLLNPREADTADLQPVMENVGATIGPYKLLQQIGEGGFGVVYMAEQQQPVRRKVALKIIKPGMDTKEVIARFEAERQALALMDHPNIAKVFDAGATETGRPYFVMELVKGIPLVEFCDENNMNMQQRLELFVSVCHAIQHAHTKGIIHRDLKPSNVMVTIHDNCPVPKVIDFGVSKAISQQLTERTLFTAYGQMVGTPVYMSPEQAQMSGLDIDTRSDVYSLGVMLFELLTGSTPLDAERLRKSGYAEMQRIIREEEAPKPSVRLSTQGSDALAKIAKCRGTDAGHLNRQVRGDLDWIVMKALEKDRNRRYETANGFAADVERFLHNESVLACPPSTAYRIRKFASRNRSAVLIGGSIAAALLLAMVGLTVGYWHAKQANDDLRLASSELLAEQQRAQQEKERAEQQATLAEERRVAAELQKELAEQATEQAVTAERKRTEALTDNYTTLGMTAAERKQSAEAMLWFAYAANMAPDPEREQFNRIRARSYSNNMLVPIAAFPHDAKWVGSAEIDASNQYIMTRRLGENHSNDTFDLGPISIFHIHSSEELSLPEEWLPLKAATWSPDGEKIAVVTGRGECLVADFPLMRKPALIASDQDAELLSYSSSGKYLTIYGTDSIQLWDTKEGNFAMPSTSHPDLVTGVDFSKDEKLLVTTCRDEKARLFDISSASRALAIVRHDVAPGSNLSRRVCVPAILVGNDRLCTIQRSNTSSSDELVVYDAEGNELHRSGNLSKQMLLNDRDRFVVTGGRFRMTFTNIESFEQDDFEPRDEDFRVALHPKNNLLAVCSSKNLELLTLDKLREIDISSCMNRLVNICRFSPNGGLLCTSERGGLVKVWQRIDRNPGTYSADVSAFSYAELSPDGKHFAAVGLSQRSSTLSDLHVFEVDTGKTVFMRRGEIGFASGSFGGIRRENRVFTDGKFLPPSGSAIAIAVSITGGRGDRQGRAGQQPGLVEVWDWKAEVKRFSVELNNEPRSLDVSPDGRYLVTLSADGTVTVLLSETGMVVDRWLAHPPALQNNWYANNGEIAFSPDGQAIVTWGTADFARIWDFNVENHDEFDAAAAPRTPRMELGHRGRVLDLRFSPDGKMIATSEWDGERLQVWDYASGERLGKPMKHPDWVMGIRFSPDGEQIVSACRDGSVRIWDWRTGQAVCPPMQHNDETHDAAFSPDGKTILTTCYEGSVGIWESKTGKRLTPAIKTDSRGIRLTVTPDGSHVIVAGHGRRAISVVKLDQATQQDERSTEDIVAMAEFFAGHRIQSSTPEGLTNEELVALYDRAKKTIQIELGLAEFTPWEDLKAEEMTALRLKIFDANQDDHLDLTEAPPSIGAWFGRLDRNLDGRLSANELPADVRKYGSPFSEYLSPAAARSRWDLIDWDNGDIAQWHPSFQQLNKHFDEDGDGRLSRAEVDHMLEKAPFLKSDILRVAPRQPRPPQRPATFVEVEGYGQKMLKWFDVDQDGRLSRSEATPRLLLRFESLDKDADGQLAEDELKLRRGGAVTNPTFFAEQVLGRVFDSETTALEELHSSFQQLVKHFDENGDGRVLRDEAYAMVMQFPFLGIEVLVASQPSEWTVPSNVQQRGGNFPFGLRSISREATDADVQRVLQVNDTNEDGKLGAGDRLSPNWSRNFARFDINKDGFLDPTEIKNAGVIPLSGKLFLEVYDTDADGVLTKSEARHPALRGFNTLDVDKSGTLNEQELDAVRGAVTSGRGGSWSPSR